MNHCDSPMEPSSPASTASPQKKAVLRIFGVGDAGITVIQQIIATGLPSEAFVALSTDAASLAASSAANKVLLEPTPIRELGTGADPERGRIIAEEHAPKL